MRARGVANVAECEDHPRIDEPHTGLPAPIESHEKRGPPGVMCDRCPDRLRRVRADEQIGELPRAVPLAAAKVEDHLRLVAPRPVRRWPKRNAALRAPPRARR